MQRKTIKNLNSSLIETLPLEILKLFTTYLTPRGIRNVGEANKFLYGTFFKPHGFELIYREHFPSDQDLPDDKIWEKKLKLRYAQLTIKAKGRNDMDECKLVKEIVFSLHEKNFNHVLNNLLPKLPGENFFKYFISLEKYYREENPLNLLDFIGFIAPQPILDYVYTNIVIPQFKSLALMYSQAEESSLYYPDAQFYDHIEVEGDKVTKDYTLSMCKGMLNQDYSLLDNIGEVIIGASWSGNIDLIKTIFKSNENLSKEDVSELLSQCFSEVVPRRRFFNPDNKVRTVLLSLLDFLKDRIDSNWYGYDGEQNALALAVYNSIGFAGVKKLIEIDFKINSVFPCMLKDYSAYQGLSRTLLGFALIKENNGEEGIENINYLLERSDPNLKYTRDLGFRNLNNQLISKSVLEHLKAEIPTSKMIAHLESKWNELQNGQIFKR